MYHKESIRRALESTFKLQYVDIDWKRMSSIFWKSLEQTKGDLE